MSSTGYIKEKKKGAGLNRWGAQVQSGALGRADTLRAAEAGGLCTLAEEVLEDRKEFFEDVMILRLTLSSSHLTKMFLLRGKPREDAEVGRNH